ncbi:capsid triplex subunit 2 [Phascolarctid gammaherpesvirus 1]|uniref:Capsid triplex subunit 2 n=1 Tax=Phascolarctid gammaherpesvirus 1 TaxID=2249313 RepID=A0A3S8D7Q8_9GAMA|nr:capsid triplex subunit 2 [Phascolarctid gammaherpesvirus 1]AZB49198.1 capsid triplex subunit 2 [Phascolarctid gammaherpesvirus 1]
MQSNKVTINFNTRLFNDELKALQSRVGSILTLRDPYTIQNIQSVGMGMIFSESVTPDYITSYNYLNSCTLGILDEVYPDNMTLTKILDRNYYELKNVYQPHFPWDSQCQLSVIPPVFGSGISTVKLESNGMDIVFPSVVPTPVASQILQKLLLFSIYEKAIVHDPDLVSREELLLRTGSITYMGRNYTLNLESSEQRQTLHLLDDLAIHSTIMLAVTPLACKILMRLLLRHDESEFLELYRGILEHPAEDYERADLQKELSAMELMLSYMQTLSGIFNLEPRLSITGYSPDSNSGTCHYGSHK